MRRWMLLSIVASAVAWAGWADMASAGGYRRAGRGRTTGYDSSFTSWHGSYYHSAWGMPLALVVPPNAEMQTKWGWGVGNTQVVPIDAQFSREYPGPGHYDPRLYHATPGWPSHTDQFGVYYIRGPW